MHGCGNDYVYLDAVREPQIEALIRGSGWQRLVQRISDRHKGIGSDGVIAVCPPTTSARRAGAHVRMRMFNADGSESEMCGNGVRCVAKFAHDRLGLPARPLRVQTGRGVLSINCELRRGRVVRATVDMGEPIFALPRIGVQASKLSFRGAGDHWGVESPFGTFIGVFVSMGNPHLTIFESWNGPSADLSRADVRKADLDRFGPELETHPAFPKRMNIHIAAPLSRSRLVMRTWERGAGLTQACGTGACAAAVAAALTDRTGRTVEVQVPGGVVHIRWDKRTNHVFMTGEAIDVFEGEWPDARA